MTTTRGSRQPSYCDYGHCPASTLSRYPGKHSSSYCGKPAAQCPAVTEIETNTNTQTGDDNDTHQQTDIDEWRNYESADRTQRSQQLATTTALLPVAPDNRSHANAISTRSRPAASSVGW